MLKSNALNYQNTSVLLWGSSCHTLKLPYTSPCCDHRSPTSPHTIPHHTTSHARCLPHLARVAAKHLPLPILIFIRMCRSLNWVSGAVFFVGLWAQWRFAQAALTSTSLNDVDDNTKKKIVTLFTPPRSGTRRWTKAMSAKAGKPKGEEAVEREQCAIGCSGEGRDADNLRSVVEAEGTWQRALSRAKRLVNIGFSALLVFGGFLTEVGRASLLASLSYEGKFNVITRGSGPITLNLCCTAETFEQAPAKITSVLAHRQEARSSG